MADQREVLANLAALIDNVLPGARRYAPIVSMNGGFVIAMPEGGQVVVWAAPSNPWFLTFTAGIARDVRDAGAALSWVNKKNSAYSFGRFYVQFPADHSLGAHVIYRESIFSELLDEAPHVLSGYVQQLLKAATGVAGDEPPNFLQAVGGAPFADSEDDRRVLVGASMG